jgi:predicted nucleic acid-binding protein
MIVVDSDILIHALRGRKPAMERVALELKTGQLATTAVNVFELRSGSRTPAERAKVEKLLAPLVILDFDNNAALKAAEVRQTLEANGTGIGMADYLIAGICLARDAVLLTGNVKHFGRVEGLTLGKISGLEG